MNASPQEQAKVKVPLHLRLTNEDWVETFKGLSRAELGVFYWIRTKDPYGDRELNINCAELGKELEIHKSSVSRALQSLASKQLIELELISVRVKQKISNRRLTLLCKQESDGKQEQTEENRKVAPMQQQTHQRNSKRTSATINPQKLRQLRLLETLILFRLIQTLYRLSQRARARILRNL